MMRTRSEFMITEKMKNLKMRLFLMSGQKMHARLWSVAYLWTGSVHRSIDSSIDIIINNLPKIRDKFEHDLRTNVLIRIAATCRLRFVDLSQTHQSIAAVRPWRLSQHNGRRLLPQNTRTGCVC